MITLSASNQFDVADNDPYSDDINPQSGVNFKFDHSYNLNQVSFMDNSMQPDLERRQTTLMNTQKLKNSSSKYKQVLNIPYLIPIHSDSSQKSIKFALDKP